MPDHGAEWVRADASAAGIGEADTLTFHSLRHTFITLLAESNIHPKTLQELARHSDLETTLRYYVHFKEQTSINAIGGL